MEILRIKEWAQLLKDVSDIDASHIRTLATCLEELCDYVHDLEQRISVEAREGSPTRENSYALRG